MRVPNRWSLDLASRKRFATYLQHWIDIITEWLAELNWIIITVSVVNASKRVYLHACVCVSRVNNVPLCICIYICGWQVRDRRGLARLNYVYDYILLQTQCHRAHTHTHCHKQSTHTHTRIHTQSRGPWHIVLKWKWLTIAAGATIKPYWFMLVMDFPIKHSLRQTKQKH